MPQKSMRDLAPIIFLAFCAVGFALEVITGSTTPMFVFAVLGLVLWIFSVPFDQWREGRKPRKRHNDS
ncbi:MAG TPA: hypothetical protein VLB83_00645 [Candidatus Paceibacterota bacterium]|nr:hypothetical protein [Candidatus Paceibacterota bacterium]